VKVSAAAEFANKVPPLDQARLIAQHGSPGAAVNATRQNDVKARADRAAFKMPKPVPDVTSAADRAEAKSKLAVIPGGGAPSDNPATLLGVLAWFERMRAPIDLKSATAGMSGSDRITVDTQIMRAQAWFGQIVRIQEPGPGESGRDAMQPRPIRGQRGDWPDGPKDFEKLVGRDRRVRGEKRLRAAFLYCVDVRSAMGSGPTTFKKTEVARIVEGVKRTGAVGTFEFQLGSGVVRFHMIGDSGGGLPAKIDDRPNPWDKVLKKQKENRGLSV
jgi:hypothetical protein